MEFDLQDGVEPLQAVRSLRRLRLPQVAAGGVNLVIAFRSRLWHTVAPSAAPPSLTPFLEVAGAGGRRAPATHRDIWLWISGSDRDVTWDHVRAAAAAVDDAARLAAEQVAFTYRNGHDMTGFVDGTANAARGPPDAIASRRGPDAAHPRYGPRPVLVAASACLITAMAALTQLTTSSPLPFLIGTYLLIGAAWGLLSPPLTSTAIGAMPRNQAGIASATAGHIGSQASRAAFTTATHFSYAIGLAAAIAVMIIVIITMRPAPTGHVRPVGCDGFLAPVKCGGRRLSESSRQAIDRPLSSAIPAVDGGAASPATARGSRRGVVGRGGHAQRAATAAWTAVAWS